MLLQACIFVVSVTFSVATVNLFVSKQNDANITG